LRLDRSLSSALIITALALTGSACSGETGTPAAGVVPDPTGAPIGPAEPAPPSDDADSGGERCVVELAEVAAYQSVKISLGTASGPVARRNADLIAGKPALFRVFVTPTAASGPADIQVRLAVRSSAGLQVHQARASISGPSQDDSLASTFDVAVPGEELSPESTLAVEIVGPTSCTGLRRTRFPATGELPLQARRTGTLRVQLVPLRYDTDASGRLPDTTDAQLALYRQTLLAMFPVASVDVTVREPVSTRVAVTGKGGWTNLLDAIRDIRALDGAPADLYYFGLVEPAASMPLYCVDGGCVTGISFSGAGSTPTTRASVGIGFTGIGAAEGLAHELAHAHGRPHAPCGQPSAPDPSFPYPEGRIGVWGYDTRAAEPLRAPTTTRDLMGYCAPRWVSDYTYRALTERSAAVNLPAQESATAHLAQALTTARPRWRTLLVDPSGVPRWGLPAEGTPPGTAVTAWLLDQNGQRIGTVDAYAIELADTDERMFWVPESGAHAIQVPAAAPAPF
jgi:hypothetical protein